MLGRKPEDYLSFDGKNYVTIKPVFVVTVQIRLKPVRSATARYTKLLILVFHYTLVFTSSDKSFLNSPLKFVALSVVIDL